MQTKRTVRALMDMTNGDVRLMFPDYETMKASNVVMPVEETRLLIHELSVLVDDYDRQEQMRGDLKFEEAEDPKVDERESRRRRLIGFPLPDRAQMINLADAVIDLQDEVAAIRDEQMTESRIEGIVWRVINQFLDAVQSSFWKGIGR